MSVINAIPARIENNTTVKAPEVIRFRRVKPQVAPVETPKPIAKRKIRLERATEAPVETPKPIAKRKIRFERATEAPVETPTPPKEEKPATPAVKKTTTSAVPKRQISDLIKNLKVGDKIQYGQSGGYMGDGGDGRDRGYVIERSILKILPRGKFEVAPKYSDNKPEIFKINKDGDWLVDTNRGHYSVYRINGTDVSYDRPDAAIEREMALMKATAVKKAEKAKDDWTKNTKSGLARMIQTHLAKSGKQLRGISTASKVDLIKYIAANPDIPRIRED